MCNRFVFYVWKIIIVLRIWCLWMIFFRLNGWILNIQVEFHERNLFNNSFFANICLRYFDIYLNILFMIKALSICIYISVFNLKIIRIFDIWIKIILKSNNLFTIINTLDGFISFVTVVIFVDITIFSKPFILFH